MKKCFHKCEIDEMSEKRVVCSTVVYIQIQIKILIKDWGGGGGGIPNVH